MKKQLQLRQHWVFDLDGTLTRPIHDFVAIRHQLNVPEGAGILEYIDQQDGKLRAELKTQLDLIETGLARQACANPGSVELLYALKQRGCQLGILTRNQRNCVDISLQKLGISELFEAEAIIACEDAAPKPDPEGIHRIIQHWNVSPEQCVMVGDYLYDLQVGKAAGLMTVHYAADRQERWPNLTDIVVQRLSELL